MLENEQRWNFLDARRGWNLHGASVDTYEERCERRVSEYWGFLDQDNIEASIRRLCNHGTLGPYSTAMANELVWPDKGEDEYFGTGFNTECIDNWKSKVGFYYRMHGGHWDHSMWILDPTKEDMPQAVKDRAKEGQWGYLDNIVTGKPTNRKWHKNPWKNYIYTPERTILITGPVHTVLEAVEIPDTEHMVDMIEMHHMENGIDTIEIGTVSAPRHRTKYAMREVHYTSTRQVKVPGSETFILNTNRWNVTRPFIGYPTVSTGQREEIPVIQSHWPYVISGMFNAANIEPSIKEMVDAGTYITNKMLDATLDRAVSGFTQRTWFLECEDIMDKNSDIDILDNDDEAEAAVEKTPIDRLDIDFLEDEEVPEHKAKNGVLNNTGMISIPAGSDPILVEALTKGMRPILNGWRVKRGTWHTSNHEHQMEQCQEIMIAKWAATVTELVTITEDKFHEHTVQAYVDRSTEEQTLKVSTLVNTMQDRRRKNETRKGLVGYGVGKTRTVSMTLDMGMKNGVGGDSNGSDQMEFIDDHWNPERVCIGSTPDIENVLPPKLAALNFDGCYNLEELAIMNGYTSRTIRRWVEEAKKKMK